MLPTLLSVLQGINPLACEEAPKERPEAPGCVRQSAVLPNLPAECRFQVKNWQQALAHPRTCIQTAEAVIGAFSSKGSPKIAISIISVNNGKA